MGKLLSQCAITRSCMCRCVCECDCVENGIIKFNYSAKLNSRGYKWISARRLPLSLCPSLCIRILRFNSIFVQWAVSTHSHKCPASRDDEILWDFFLVVFALWSVLPTGRTLTRILSICLFTFRNHFSHLITEREFHAYLIRNFIVTEWKWKEERNA